MLHEKLGYFKAALLFIFVSTNGLNAMLNVLATVINPQRVHLALPFNFFQLIVSVPQSTRFRFTILINLDPAAGIQ